MPILTVPYSKSGMILDIPDENFSKILQSKAHDYVVNKTQEEIVEDSIDNPIGSQKLEELVKNKKSVVIITSDHTRPVPSKVTMPIILRRLVPKAFANGIATVCSQRLVVQYLPTLWKYVPILIIIHAKPSHP